MSVPAHEAKIKELQKRIEYLEKANFKLMKMVEQMTAWAIRVNAGLKMIERHSKESIKILRKK